MYCGTVASSRCCITDVTRAWPCSLAVIATAATSPSCSSAGGTVWCAGPHGAAGTWVCWASCAICDRAGRSPSRPTARAAGGADEAGRPGRGATRQRAGDRRGRAGLVGVVDRVVGSVLPAATVRQGGRHVQRTLRPGRGKRGVAPRDHRGGTGAAGGHVRGEPVRD